MVCPLYAVIVTHVLTLPVPPTALLCVDHPTVAGVWLSGSLALRK